jgi:hypothetical protein
MSKAKESFHIIQKMVSTAKASWAIWFELYCNFEHGGPYALVMQLYYPFFDAIYHSQIHYAFIILNDLFGKRRNTHSLAYLIKSCRAEGLDEKGRKNARLYWLLCSDIVEESEFYGESTLAIS